MLNTKHLLTSIGLAMFTLLPAARADQKPGSTVPVYIGTYTGKKSQGIYLCHLDTATGALSKPELAGEMPNPSFVAVSPDHKFLYACGEFGPFPTGSAIGAFAIKPDWTLTSLNQQPAGGGGPCYVAVDKTGKNALVANYGTGSVAVLPIDVDGKLSPPGSIDQHAGTDPKKETHAHCIDLDPSNHFALSCDLGLDRVYMYKFDAAKGVLTANDPPAVSLAHGSGPRHLVFNSNGKFVYTINESASTISVFSFDAEQGILRALQTLPTLPADFTGKNSTAELVIHPSGKFIYGSNRGHDSIALFTIDAQSGMLHAAGHTSTQGKTPRGFGIDPTGNWLIVGNQESDNLVEFHIDGTTGELKPTGTTLEVSTPVCVKFVG